MNDFLYRAAVLFRKEIRIILKDPRSRIILVMPIILQALLFGYAASFDLNTVPYALIDEDRSEASRDLVAMIEGGGIFRRTETLGNASQIAAVIDHKRALVVVHIGADFERRLRLDEEVPVQVIADGRNANTGGVASGYVTSVIEAFNRMWQEKQGQEAASFEVVSRAWFNPNLETRWYMIPGLLATLAMIQILMLTALSVAREKEEGTFDQLLVTPLGPLTIMMGKALPSIAIGIGQSSLVLLIAIFWFRIPMNGSLLLLYGGLLVFNCAVVGIGLVLSALAASMQQAMLYSYLVIVPMMMLSGFTTPIRSMPMAVQYATYLNPMRYGVDLARRVYLEGAGPVQIMGDIWPLVLMSVLFLGSAAWLFRRRLG